MRGVQVYRQQEQSQSFLIVVSVSGDAAFPVYNNVASNSDLALFRGMLLAVTFASPVLSGPQQQGQGPAAELPAADTTAQCSVMQAFLPKFDISRTAFADTAAADASIAASIQQGAAQHVMLVSIKHSGHLATISDTLVSSKSSVASVHCAAAVILLHAHFARVSARYGHQASVYRSRPLFHQPLYCLLQHAVPCTCLTYFHDMMMLCFYTESYQLTQ